MKQRFLPGLTLSFLVMLALLGCSKNDDVAGTGSQDGNAIHGYILDEDSKRIPLAKVSLIPADYNPAEVETEYLIKTTESDSTGYYEFTGLDSGGYNIEASSPDRSLMALIMGLEIIDRDITADAILKATGYVTIALEGYQLEGPGQIYFIGTRIVAVIDSASLSEGSVTMEGVPAGTFDNLNFKSEEGGLDTILDTGVYVPPVDTVVLTGDSVIDTSSQAEYFLTGAVFDEQNQRSSEALVTLVPLDYNPVDSLPDVPDNSTQTDSMGMFSFSLPEAGTYNIAVSDKNETAYGMTVKIEVPDKPEEMAADVFLAKPGVLCIILPGYGIKGSGHVYIPGTLVSAVVEQDTSSDYTVCMDKIPEGNYDGFAYVTESGDGDTVLADKFEAVISDTTLLTGNYNPPVSYSAWSGSAKILINTSPTGADVTENVLNYSLLVQLSDPKIFSNSLPNGEDLRFTDADDNALDYEIGQWDVRQSFMEVWVKVDTIFGGTADQEINMYWGNPSAKSESDGEAVFDTTIGFIGVYHLEENGSKVAYGYKNSSSDLYHGTGVGVDEETDEICRIGFCPRLDGIDDFISLGNVGLHNNSVYAVSFWVDADSEQQDKIIFSEGGVAADPDSSSLISLGTFENSGDIHEKLSVYVRNDDGEEVVNYNTTADIIFEGKWHHVVFVDSMGSYSVYVDGQISLEGSYTKAGKALESTVIGAVMRDSSGEQQFKGRIDEVRLMNTGFSLARAKLDYEIQRSKQVTVSIRKEDP